LPVHFCYEISPQDCQIVISSTRTGDQVNAPTQAEAKRHWGSGLHWRVPLSIASIESIVATASRNENATAWAEDARAISSAAISLVGDPQNPTNICARGARRRIRLTRKRARAGELVLISDRHTTEASLNSGK
jgi:hypothetical protein